MEILEFVEKKTIKAKMISHAGMCGFKGAYTNADFQLKPLLSLNFKKVFVEMLKLPSDCYSDLNIEHLINENVPSELFRTAASRAVLIKDFKSQAFRTLEYLASERWLLIETGKYIYLESSNFEELELKNSRVSVYVDAIFEKPSGEIVLVNFKDKSSFTKKPSKKEHKNVSASIDLYLLHLACRVYALEKDVPVSSCFIYLKNGNDKYLDVTDEFIDSANHNLAYYDFEDDCSSVTLLNKRINKFLRGEISSEKCEGEYCNDCFLSEFCGYQHLVPLKIEPRKEELIKSSGEVKWTEEQIAFINFSQGICRTNAVAGAGKTTVIANRFIKLLKDGYDPSSFLLITFTEKGVQELKEKILYWLIKENLDQSWISRIKVKTFNSFGFDLIKQYYDRLGFEIEPILMDRIDRIHIIKEICDEWPMITSLRYNYPYLNMFNAKGAYLELSDLFEEIRKYPGVEKMSVHQLEEVYGVPLQIAEMYQEFRKVCKERCIIDYDDQIYYACDLMDYSDIVQDLGLQHIIIDEVQDTNASQMFIVAELIKTPYFTSLVICGDDSQSIYGFRGADQKIILDFDKCFENVQDLRLTNNFRSTRQIATVANRINELNYYRLDKEIVAHRDGEVPTTTFNKDYLNEVLGFVKREIDRGVPLSEIAIIGRKRKELIAINRYFTEQGVISSLVVSESLKDNPQIKRIIAWAKYLLNPKEEYQLCQFLQMVNYVDYANATNKVQWLKREVEIFKYRWEALSDEMRYSVFLREIQKLGEVFPACEKLFAILSHYMFLTLEEMLRYVIEIDLHDSNLQLSPMEGLDAVVLTTAHASKGREFHSVFLLVDSFINKPLGGKNNEYKIHQVEEERRLLFVGVTRAKEILHLNDGNIEKSGFGQEIDYLLNGIETDHVRMIKEFLLDYDSVDEAEEK